MPIDLEFEAPDEVHERLLIKATERGLSLSDYLILLLREAVEHPLPHKAGAGRQAQQSEGS
jgi:hypothetical protein